MYEVITGRFTDACLAPTVSLIAKGDRQIITIPHTIDAAEHTCNHFTQPTAFCALYRQSRRRYKDGTLVLRGEQQYVVNSAGHTWQKKSEGLIIASAVRMNVTSRSIKKLPFIPISQPKERSED